MAKKLILFVLVVSLAAFAQHGRGGNPPSGMPAGGPPSGMPAGGPPSGMGNAGGHDMSGSHDMSRGPMQSGPKSPDALLTQNTKLSSKLQSLLPSGTTPQQACSGFKNLGQCVAAIHVAHNLDIPFADLKAKMTGSSPVSLGKAIQELKPSANAQEEAKKGTKQAHTDISETKS